MKRITGEKPKVNWEDDLTHTVRDHVYGTPYTVARFNEQMQAAKKAFGDELATSPLTILGHTRLFVVQVTEMDEYRVVCQDKVIAVCSSGARAQRAIARYDRLHPITPTTSRGFKIEYVWLDEGVGEDE